MLSLRSVSYNLFDSFIRSGVDSTIDVIKAAAETKKNNNERIGHVSERRMDVGQQGVREGEWKKRQRRHHNMLKKDNAVQLTRSFIEAIGQAGGICVSSNVPHDLFSN